MSLVTGVYVLGGITLVSEIPIPELVPVSPSATSLQPVHVRLGEVPLPGPDAIEVDPDCFATPSYYFLRVPGIANYLVQNGDEVVVSPAAGALELDVRAYLLGTAFAVLCHQRGLLPLHASAVKAAHGVVAFLGRSGQGKSSLAAHLARDGFPAVSDDICLLEGGTTVLPTAPWLKLWRESLDRLGQSASGLPQVFSQDDKYRLTVDTQESAGQLATLVFLENTVEDVASIEPVPAAESVPLLMNLIHQAYLLEAIGQRKESFLKCSQVCARVKAFRLHRPWGWDKMEQTVDALGPILQGQP